MSKKAKRAQKKEKGKLFYKLVVVAILMLLAFLILKYAPNYVNTEISDNVNLVINNSNVTGDLKKDIIIENGIIYISKEDIQNFFDPYIYYDVLPYAYAFGLTQVWSDHFKDIEMPLPPYYSGHMTYWDWYYLHRMKHAFNHLSHPPVPVNHSSGRHGGSIGGFGGGGFSGGGFGGSHGGSW